MRRTLPALLTVLLSYTTLPATQQQKKPKTIFELVHAFEYTFSQILTPEEFESFRSKSPEEIKAESPELYEKIRQNVKRWTDEWVRDAVQTYEKLPEARLHDALASISRVDGVLKPYFEDRGWPYRTINAVFLPQRLFHDERRHASGALGMFIPFYPEVFFATVDLHAPLDMIFMHETIHFNEKGVWLGQPLTEGIAHSVALQLVVDNELATSKQLKRFSVYEEECKLVDFLVEKIVERTDGDRSAALDMLLEATITGDHSGVEAVLGKKAWERVLETSRTVKTWHLVTRGMREALQ